jgi:predicted  nucleic acid-binding Zn-ribbon protein
MEGIEEKVVNLIHLQEVDLALLALHQERDDLPQRIELFREEIENKKTAIENDKERLEKLEQKRRKKEGELRDEEEKLKKSEQKLTEVKTNKEYTAVLKEIQDHRAMNSALEEQILVMMEEMDFIRSDLSTKENEFEQSVAEIEVEIQTLSERSGELENMLVQKEEERVGLIANIDADYLKKYETLRAKGHNPVVVQVRKGVCTGCHMNLPPQFSNEMQRDRDIKACPNCNRMIYWKE